MPSDSADKFMATSQLSTSQLIAEYVGRVFHPNREYYAEPQAEVRFQALEAELNRRIPTPALAPTITKEQLNAANARGINPVGIITDAAKLEIFDQESRRPEPDCGYNANMDKLAAELQRPLILNSTRSHDDENAWRDMDGFNKDEELARLRRAVHEVRRMNPNYFERHMPWSVDPTYRDTAQDILRAQALLAFIGEAFTNIDESLSRLGPLPNAWKAGGTP